jgi:hypothetical protein
MLKTTVIAHAMIQRILAGVTKWRVTKVVRQRNRFGQVFMQAQRTRNASRELRYLYAMREARAKQVAFVIHKYLRFILEPTKSGGVNNTVAIALEHIAQR